MESKNYRKWLKLGYLTGIIGDFVFGLIIIFLPDVMKLIWGLEVAMTPMERFWARYYGIIVIAWAWMLIFAMKKPVERNPILGITLLWILIPFMILQLASIHSGLLAFSNLGLLFVLEFALFALIGKGYLCGKKLRNIMMSDG